MQIFQCELVYTMNLLQHYSSVEQKNDSVVEEAVAVQID